jgi:hypothetical protein
LNASQHVGGGVFRDGDRRPEREKGPWRETLAARQGHSQELKCFSWWWGYELMVEELLKSHLTTRIVTSSLKSSPQKSAAAL